jgi:hypothetical protein
MMEARGMYPDGWHPVSPWRGVGKKLNSHARCFTRTQRPPRYYFIDFGISGFYDRRQPVRDVVIRGGDRTCPDNRETHADPFPTDVYYLGNVIKNSFVDVRTVPNFLIRKQSDVLYRTRKDSSSSLPLSPT